MIQLHARLTGDQQVTATLRGIAQRSRPPQRGRMLSAIGQRVALRHMPKLIRENELGWPKASGRYRGWRAGGQALVDTSRLVNSWAWLATQDNLRIWTAVIYAPRLNDGGEVRPTKGRFLLIPLSPPLKMTEARGFPRGKEAIRGRYPGSFFLLKGPEGPGIYRSTRRGAGGRATGTRRRAGCGGRGGGIERIAAAKRSVRVPAFHFGHWRQEWMPDLTSIAGQFIVSGQLPMAASASGGNPDRGPRGGQLR